MNLAKVFALLSASLGAVAGFHPSGVTTAFPVASRQASRAASSALFGEATAAEATVEACRRAMLHARAVAGASAAASSPAAAKPAAAARFDKSIYIGNISFEAKEGDLREAFAQHGKVLKVQMPVHRSTGLSRGFAFVAMSNADEHAAAIAAMDQTEIRGRTVYVNESLPKEKVAQNKKKYDSQKKQLKATSKIYVGNLNFGTTAESLKAAFEEFGAVADCFIPSDAEGNPRGFGFIQMGEEHLEGAIEGMNGTELDGRALNVNISLPKGTKSAPKQTKLYVGNLSWGTEEEPLRELFEEYGKVLDCYIPTDRETGQHRGFAFVCMDPEDALRAADETDGYELDGRILRVNEAQPKGAGNSYSNDGEGYDGDDAAYDESADGAW